MKIKITQRYIFFANAKANCVFLLFLFISCTPKEPAFSVKGDPAVTKDIIVNVEMLLNNENRITTAYYHGKSYDIDNRDVLRYKIYVSYKNSSFYSVEMDNLHHKIKGIPINEITIEKKNNEITASYKPLKESENVTATALQPDSLFFGNSVGKSVDKQKFTTFYKK